MSLLPFLRTQVGYNCYDYYLTFNISFQWMFYFCSKPFIPIQLWCGRHSFPKQFPWKYALSPFTFRLNRIMILKRLSSGRLLSELEWVGGLMVWCSGIGSNVMIMALFAMKRVGNSTVCRTNLWPNYRNIMIMIIIIIVRTVDRTKWWFWAVQFVTGLICYRTNARLLLFSQSGN